MYVLEWSPHRGSGNFYRLGQAPAQYNAVVITLSLWTLVQTGPKNFISLFDLHRVEHELAKQPEVHLRSKLGKVEFYRKYMVKKMG